MAERLGVRSALRKFLNSEAAGGIVLMVAAILAMIVANSALYDSYHHILNDDMGPIFSPELTSKLGPMTLHLWINDGLMAIFFFLVGLEIKREFVDGRLSSWDKRRLPIIAAVAGMAVPAAIFLSVTWDYGELVNGWAIPAATDIAFAIGVLALLGKRAPTSLKLFLVTVAIVDDMGAVAIIALVYTPSLSTIWLFASVLVLAVMYYLNATGVRRLLPYVLLSGLLWYCVLLSGVHATIAGVLAAMMIPITKTPGAPDAVDSPLHQMEHAVAPWSAFFIVPIFGFANAGVNLAGMGVDQILAPLPLGIALGLFVGKQIGIFGSVWLAVKFGVAGKLRGATWLQIYGTAMLCGIGFTMSLFIGGLAFPGNALLIEEAKIGVLLGSAMSGVVGFLLLRFAPLHQSHDEIEAEEAGEIARDGDIENVCEDMPAKPGAAG
ncbi:Na+/H+ antiporter NhaA [Parasphingopyxis algicola]|uniref:Na+/H+ antiporter NhaA n=1 Tax=Parasphingopyxis algicola TaxID=2026624 RepID=UPI0015A106C1|nr:Na+/H+ antiporter NhaA [Parasphingopyxis algicola]QLC25777.1 Na+/H+ antiporter NhaA [Parasphingopyxis algicola]